MVKFLEKMVPSNPNGSSRVLQASKQPPLCRWEPGLLPVPWPDSTCLWFCYSRLNLFIPLGKLIKVIVKPLAGWWEERGSVGHIPALAALGMLSSPLPVAPTQGLTHLLPLG